MLKSAGFFKIQTKTQNFRIYPLFVSLFFANSVIARDFIHVRIKWNENKRSFWIFLLRDEKAEIAQHTEEEINTWRALGNVTTRLNVCAGAVHLEFYRLLCPSIG